MSFGSGSYGSEAYGGEGVLPGEDVEASVSLSGSAPLDAAASDEFPASVSFEATVDLDPTATIDISYASVEFRSRGRIGFTTRIIGDQWCLVSVDQDGARLAEIDNAKITSVVDDLNGEGAIEFGLPVLDPKAPRLPPMREVQVWKGDTILKWGPVFRPQANSRSLAFTGAGLEWWFSRRHFGKADRTNYLPNGDFEDGPGGWRIGYFAPWEPLANKTYTNFLWRISQARAMTGRRSLYVEQTSSTTPKYGVAAAHSFVWQVDPVATPEGDVWSAVAYCFIPSAKWRGPNLQKMGLELGRFSTTKSVAITPEGGGPTTNYPAPIETVTVTLDENTPRDTWVKMEATMEAPPTGEAEFVQVTLACPNGAIYWDRAGLVLDEATRFYGVDQAQIAEGVVEHLQDPDYDKTDLNIGTSCPPTGVIRDRVYLHAEHENGKGALDDLTDMSDGLDYSVEITPSRRTFTTHYPMKGVDHLDLVLEYGKNVEDFNWAFDGAVASNQVITLGSGQGSIREEGVATDLDALEGVSLEEVYVATEGADISSLDDRAAARLEIIKNPVILELMLKDTTLAGMLRTGDRVRVRIDRGYVQVEAWYRVVRTILNPSSDKMSVVVNLFYGAD